MHGLRDSTSLKALRLGSSDPNFGITFTISDDESRPIVYGDVSTIGIIGPAADADDTVFPLDTPVLVNSNQTSMTALLGASGYLADAINGINDQLAATQRAARCVIVRTAAGTNADATIALQQSIANIIGDSTQGTGVWAFTKAANLVSVTPRLIIAPGFTSQMANSVDDVTLSAAGSGYTPNATLNMTFAGGGSNAVQATGTVKVASDGTIDPTSLTLTTLGAWYTSAPTATLPAPGGSGVQATLHVTGISAGANPVVAGLAGVLNQILGHAIVESAGTSQTNDNAWRETINSQRIIPVSGGCRVLDANGDVVIMPFAPRLAGIAVARDFATGGPFHSWANQAVQGIVGPARDIDFSLTDGANEGQELLTNNIGIVVRGEVGNDFAIANGGFVYIGTDNAGSDPLWQFYNITRGRDFIHIALLRTLRILLGQYGVGGRTIQAVLNTMSTLLADLMASESILGYNVNFSPASNTADTIRNGKLSVGFKAEEPSPLKLLNVTSARYREAIDAMVDELASQLSSLSV